MAVTKYVWILFLFLLQPAPVQAQYVVSSTAAWSSQIIAFWGAIIIAAHVGKVGSAGTSIFSNIRLILRARAITNALSRGNWFLHSGWNNGKIRTDVAVVSWRSAGELKALASRISMQIETFGAGQWQVLVLGRQLKNEAANEGTVHWIRCPRTERFCGAKIKETDENFFPLSEQDLSEAMNMLRQSPPVPVDKIVQEMEGRRDKRASRPTYLTEQHQEMQVNAGQLSFAYIFTAVAHNTTPYLDLQTWTGSFGSERGARMLCTVRMYILVHLLIACAVGLMAAATGRGLAVWLMAVRLTVLNLGGKNVNGYDVLQSLICMDGAVLQYETKDGSQLVAGDSMTHPMRWWSLVEVFAIPSLEIMIILAGWLYGALNAERIQPSGVVGNGMLCLSITVGLSLSVRALLSLRNQGKGRLVGIWRTSHSVRYTVGVESLEISVPDLIRMEDEMPFELIATLLRDNSTDDITVVESFLRLPVVATLLEYLVATQILRYRYEGDEIVSRDGQSLSAKSESPWLQSYCCIFLTMACCCVSVIYAYYPLPRWVKLVTEVVIAISAVWFNSVDLAGSFMHEHETSICFMVATLVVSSVWYVGLEGVG